MGGGGGGILNTTPTKIQALRIYCDLPCTKLIIDNCRTDKKWQDKGFLYDAMQEGSKSDITYERTVCLTHQCAVLIPHQPK